MATSAALPSPPSGGVAVGRWCTHGQECTVYRAVKEKYAFTQDNLDHITQFLHPDPATCRYGVECRAWQRLAQGGVRLDDCCHCAVYQHPARVERDLGEHSQYAHARWRTWNLLAKDDGIDSWTINNWTDCVGNRFFNPLRGQRGYLRSGGQDQRAVEMMRTSTAGCSQLEDEVRKEGFGHVLTCSDGQPLSQVVLQKLKHPEHRKLGCPLSYDEMLSIILYTGTDAYSDLRRYQLEHQELYTHDTGKYGFTEDPIPYERWNVFDLTLSLAIEELGHAQFKAYGRQRGLPSEYVYHGSYQCNPPPDDRYVTQYGGGGVLPTVTSFSWDVDVAKAFCKGEGLLVKFHAAAVKDREEERTETTFEEKMEGERARTACRQELESHWCDVSWISKFPRECEAVFANESHFGDIVKEEVVTTAPRLVMLHIGPERTQVEEGCGCIHEDCCVTMADGKAKPVAAVVPGDMVRSADGMTARIVCTIRTHVNGSTDFCRLSQGCCVTFEHPVKLPQAQGWQIPTDIVAPSREHVRSVYNFVVEGPAYSVMVDGIACVTLGHCLEHPVLTHQVWGSGRILAYLRDQPGYPRVVLESGYDIGAILGYPDHAEAVAAVEQLEPKELRDAGGLETAREAATAEQHTESVSSSKHGAACGHGRRLCDQPPSKLLPSPPEPMVLKGILWPNNIRCVEQLEALLELPCRASDVFVASYPKSGTHWVHKLVGAILRNGGIMYPVEFVQWHQSTTWRGGMELKRPLAHADWPSPRVMATHCPLWMLPRDAEAKRCRVVYVVRDVKDVLTSQFFFCNAHPAIPDEPDLEKFLGHFVAGAALDAAEATRGGALLGGIASHRRAYAEAMQAGRPIHIVSYEDLQANPAREIERLGAFLGCALGVGDVAAVQAQASFSSMKAAARERAFDRFDRSARWSDVFWRKGVAGDWPNLLTSEQAARVDEAFAGSLVP